MALSTTTSSSIAADARPRSRWTTGWRKGLLLTGAAVTFLLAIVGAILPGIPTTPFLLLTSYCLVRSSPRLHRRLLASPWLGGVLRDWQRHRGIRRHTKVQAIAVIVLVVALSFYFSGLPLPHRLGVLVLAVVGVGIVARLRVIDD